MKKYIGLCLLALAAVWMTSCQKNEPQLRKKTVDLEVAKSKWTFEEDINMFFCHFDVPEITNTVYNYGEWSVNREYNSGTANAYQVALPETTYKIEQLVDSNNEPVEEYAYYAQHIDYAVGIGYVEVFYTISDYLYPEGFKPEAMLFRLHMTY